MSKKKMSQNINLVLLHGFAETTDKVWFPWIHAKAEENGWRVWAPSLPNSLKPEYAAWMKAVRKQAKTWDQDTVIVGHSLGGVLALRILAEVKVKVKAVITVGSPYTSTVNVASIMRFFDDPINWALVRQSAKKFVTIHAKNDPLIFHDEALRYQEALNSKLVMTPKDGHFIGKKAKAVWEELEKIV